MRKYTVIVDAYDRDLVTNVMDIIGTSTFDINLTDYSDFNNNSDMPDAVVEIRGIPEELASHIALQYGQYIYRIEHE